jgi:Zn-finger nucleic acid-binding protein
MRHYERNGVVVDQCSECRGIFLDRGELERLVTAETQWAEETYAPQRSSRGHDSRHDYRQPQDYRQPRRHKRKNFFEELFD